MKHFSVLFFLFAFLLPTSVFAQSEGFDVREVSGVVQEIRSIEEVDGDFQQYDLLVESEYGVLYEVETKDSYELGVGYTINVGDSVHLAIIDDNGEIQPYLTDVHRERGLLIAFIAFAIVALIVGLGRGALSLLGLVFTSGILLFGVFPMILQGHDPLLVTLVASAIILLVNMHLSHGFKWGTFMAYLGTLGGLVLTYLFTEVFIHLARLSGVASDEGALLFWELDPIQAPVGILAAGMILGAVGVLDDVAMTQAELVEEISHSQPDIKKKELFSRAMRIGRHHVASTVNTLVLVYAGAALPVFLLFLNQSNDLLLFLNNEQVAEEIIRILAGTCALVLTVPLSTWFAVARHESVDSEKKTA